MKFAPILTALLFLTATSPTPGQVVLDSDLELTLRSTRARIGGIEVSDGLLWKGDRLRIEFDHPIDSMANRFGWLFVAPATRLAEPETTGPLLHTAADLALYTAIAIQTDAQSETTLDLPIESEALNLFGLVPAWRPDGSVALDFSPISQIEIRDPAGLEPTLHPGSATIRVRSERAPDGGYQNLSVDFLPSHTGPLAGMSFDHDPDRPWSALWHPLIVALRFAVPGDVVDIHGEALHPFQIGGSNSSLWHNLHKGTGAILGGTEAEPITVRGRGGPDGTDKIVVDALPTIGDTINFLAASGRAPQHLHFENLTVEAGNRAAIFIGKVEDAEFPFRGLWFYDVDMLGSADHDSFQNVVSYTPKWGMRAYHAADLRFCGIAQPARIEGIKKEHAFYVSSFYGGSGRAISIVNVVGRLLGRTFYQNRRYDGGPTETPGGIALIRDCEAHDWGLEIGDIGAGGAYTICGFPGWTILENCVARGGFDPLLVGQSDVKGIPFDLKTPNALVVWEGQVETDPDGTPANGRIDVRGCDFETRLGTLRRLVSLSSATEVEIRDCRFVSGCDRALEIDPPGGLSSARVGWMKMTHTELSGSVELGGKELTAGTQPSLSGFLKALAGGLASPSTFPGGP